MKENYGKLASHIANAIYRRMYKSNYEPSSGEKNIISNRINTENKLALVIVLRDVSPVNNKDSQLNIKALKLPD